MLVMIDPVIHYFAYTWLQRWMYIFNPISWCSIELWSVVGSGKPLVGRNVMAADLMILFLLNVGIELVWRRERTMNIIFEE